MCGLLMYACAGGTSHDAPPDSFTLLLPRDIQQLDPRYVGDIIGLKVSRLIFASLTRIDPITLETVPDLAREVRVIGDSEYVVALRPDLHFSDGSALDAEDVVATFRSMVDPAMQSRYASTYQRIASVTALDALTISFRLTGPHASFPTDLEVPILRAEDAHRRLSMERGDPLIGAGPYVIARRQPGVIELEHNPRWYAGTPRVPRVRMLVVHDDNTRALRMLSGAADLSLNGIPAGLVPLFTGRKDFVVETAPGIGTTYLGINTVAPGLSDANVRKALALAIDRKALIKAKFSGRAQLASSFVPLGHWAFDPNTPAYEYDPDAARALLDRAGLTGSPRARWVLRCDSERSRVSIARAIAAMLADVGIAVRVQTTENATLLADLDRGHFELSLAQFSEVIEPHVLSWFFASDRIPGPGRVGLNRWRFRDKVVDEVLETGRRSLDREERKRAYTLLQRRLAEQLPVVPLWHEDVVAVRSTRVRSIEIPRDSRFTTLAR
ncbi:MAG TPA: ABC transporter substrate-binding protein [Polyangiales bacterium]|nr:ABC transporter substrate-binding protein [Polyangiales bacterium]